MRADTAEKTYSYEESLGRRVLGSPGRFFSSLLEYFTRVGPIPPGVLLRLHAARGVKFADRRTVLIRPMVKLAPRFPWDLSVGRNVFFDVCAMVLTDELVTGQRPHRFRRTRVRIGDDVYVGMGAIILPGVTLHQGAVVLPGSVVYEDVPPHTVVRGNPARAVETLPPTDRSRAATPPLAPDRGGAPEGYDERGVSRQAYPYEQSFSRTLRADPGRILRTLWTHCILTLPVPPRLATVMYAKMGVRFDNWRKSGVVLPIFIDPVSPADLRIGQCSHISSGCLLATHFFDPRLPGFCYRKKKVSIGENVFMGMGTIIGDGLSVGDYGVVAANSVLFGDVQENRGVIGNPARAFARMPSKRRDYALKHDRDVKFHDDTGKSEDLYPFEHRLLSVLREHPGRVLSFLLDYYTSALPLTSYHKALLLMGAGIRIKDPADVRLGANVYLERLAPEQVSVGRNVTIMDWVKVLAHYPEATVDGCYYRTGPVVIEDDVFIGTAAVIANAVTIGQGAVILPGTLIVQDVPAHAIIGGFPSEILGYRSYEDDPAAGRPRQGQAAQG